MNINFKVRPKFDHLARCKRIIFAAIAASTMAVSPIAVADQNFDTEYATAGRAEIARLEKLPLAEANAAAMKLIQKSVREKFLRNIYVTSQRNPGFRLGALRVASLLERFDKIQIDSNLAPTSQHLDPERTSDFYLTGQDLALINGLAMVEAPPHAMVALFFHVMAGASGFQDEDYQLTLALLLYEMTYTPGPIADFLKTIDFNQLLPQTVKDLYRPFDPLAGKGGFTGLGGGGDITSLSVKMAMIEFAPVVESFYVGQTLCKERWQNRTTYLKDVLNFELESSASVPKISVQRGAGGKQKVVIPQFKLKDQKAREEAATNAMIALCLIKSEP